MSDLTFTPEAAEQYGKLVSSAAIVMAPASTDYDVATPSPAPAGPQPWQV